MSPWGLRRLACLSAVWWLGCSAAPPTSVDAGANDSGTDAGVDAGIDAGGDSGIDAGSDGGADAGPPGWTLVTTVQRDGGVRVEQVQYLSDGLRINGRVCRPDDSLRHPLIIANHGGFAGLTALGSDSFCVGGGQNGFVIAESSYRGEDGSDGTIEVCLGEVDDVVAMLRVLQSQPYVDPGRIGAWGGSHGGCITLRLAVREPQALKAAVDFFGPTDFTTLYGFWEQELDGGEPPPCPDGGAATCQFVHQTLVGQLQASTGGSPATVPAAYVARSPLGELSRLSVPTLMLHGTADYFVDVHQLCEARAAFADAGIPVAAWYVDAAFQPQDPALCGGGFLDAGPTPSGWAPGINTLFIEGQGHGFTGDAGAAATNLAVLFLIGHL